MHITTVCQHRRINTSLKTSINVSHRHINTPLKRIRHTMMTQQYIYKINYSMLKKEDIHFMNA